MSKVHVGSSFDSFLDEEGILAETEAIAIKRVVAFQLNEAIADAGLSRAELAASMGTSRTAVARLLDTDSPSVTLLTLVRAAAAVGKRIRLALEERASVSTSGQQVVATNSGGAAPRYTRHDETIDDDWAPARLPLSEAPQAIAA